MTAPNLSLPLLRLFNLVSPALPIGSYSYSQGLEWAIEHGGVDNAEKIQGWITGVLGSAICATDIPALVRLDTALQNGDMDSFIYWNHWCLASRESQQLLDEDLSVGRALVKVLASQQSGISTLLQEAGLRHEISFVSAWSLAAKHWNIAISDAALGYAWSWLENQIAVAGKVLPLGQTQAQRIIDDMLPKLLAFTERGLDLADEEMGQSLPGWVMACVNHETQYSRLFRS